MFAGCKEEVMRLVKDDEANDDDDDGANDDDDIDCDAPSTLLLLCAAKPSDAFAAFLNHLPSSLSLCLCLSLCPRLFGCVAAAAAAAAHRSPPLIRSV